MKLHKSLILYGISAPLLLGGYSSSSAEPTAELATQLRRPVALALSTHGDWLFAANRDSGTISIIGLEHRQVVDEIAVGPRLTGLVSVPHSGDLLAICEDPNQLVSLRARGPRLDIVSRLELPDRPENVAASADARRATVAMPWSRRLALVDLVARDDDSGLELKIFKTVEVPFPPRVQLPLEDQQSVIVADAFGGRLAAVDFRTGELKSVRELPAHNIRGMAVSPDGQTLFIAHQYLNSLAQTSFDDVHWGVLMTNALREVRLEALLDQEQELLAGSRLHQLGDVGTGGADPAEVALGPSGEIFVALSGAGELAVYNKDSLHIERVTVGRGPRALISAADQNQLYVANTFGDSISVVNFDSGKVAEEVSLGPMPQLTSAQRGEVLFHDARLAHDDWLSCQSCHTNGHSNGSLNDNLSDGSFGTPKRVLSLLGVADTKPWAWDGRVTKLEDQVRKSVAVTMRGAEPSEVEVDDLVAFLKTLEPPPRPAQTWRKTDESAIARGGEIFRARGCVECHAPPTYTSAGSYEVGLIDESGKSQFNPPSLRGVGHRRLLFHDGRAESLEEVFTEHRHRLDDDLSPAELRNLVAFLRSL